MVSGSAEFGITSFAFGVSLQLDHGRKESSYMLTMRPFTMPDFDSVVCVHDFE